MEEERLRSLERVAARSRPSSEISRTVVASMKARGKMPQRPFALWPDQHQCSAWDPD